jgi:hypothetical protein
VVRLAGGWSTPTGKTIHGEGGTVAGAECAADRDGGSFEITGVLMVGIRTIGPAHVCELATIEGVSQSSFCVGGRVSAV